MLLDMLALHNTLVEVYGFVGETHHLTSTHGAAVERVRGTVIPFNPYFVASSIVAVQYVVHQCTCG